MYHIYSVIRLGVGVVGGMGVQFSFQNNLRNLDPSYKMHLDFWDCFIENLIL